MKGAGLQRVEVPPGNWFAQERSVEEPEAAMLFKAAEGVGLSRLLLSNFTHEGASRRVAGLQGGRAHTAPMVRCVA